MASDYFISPALIWETFLEQFTFSSVFGNPEKLFYNEKLTGILFSAYIYLHRS